MRKAYLGRPLDVLDRILKAWLLGSKRFRRWVRLWLRARFHIEERVSKDLSDRAEQAESFIGKRNWLDHDVLAWDYEVRSILRKHLGPDHLRRYERKTTLEAPQEDDVDASAEALKRAQHEIRASAWALHRETIVPRGGLSDVWWFRALVTGLMPSGALLVALIVALTDVTAGGGPSLTESSNATFGTTQNVVQDPGEVVVEISPVPSPTPAGTPEPGTTPTPTPILPVSEQPAIDIPAEPQKDQPTHEAEAFFEAGVAALEAANFELAKEGFEDAIDAEPGFVRAYYNLAVTYDNIDSEEADQAAVDNYTAAIDLWNSLESDGDGLLFEAKLARGLILVSYSTDKQAICLGRSDLLDYLERGDPSSRNAEAVEKALASIDVQCEQAEEVS